MTDIVERLRSFASMFIGAMGEDEQFYVNSDPETLLGGRDLHEAAAEIERLRAALAPFAAFIAEMPTQDDDQPLLQNWHDDTVTYGDFRRAAAALTAAPTEEPQPFDPRHGADH